MMKLICRNTLSTKTLFTMTMLMAYLLVCALPQIAGAQLIAYEGFDYEVGDLGVVADPVNGGTAGGTGWEKDGGGADIGWVQSEDASATSLTNPTVVSDAALVVDNPASWGYTDNQGNSLQTSGRAMMQQDWAVTRRNFDLTNVDASLLRTSDRNLFQAPDAFGAGGAELWVSFLGQGVAQDGSIGSFQLTDGFGGSQLKRIEVGRPWRLQLDGSADPAGNEAWGIEDHQAPGATRTKEPTGDLYSDKVFFVTRIQYFDSGQAIPGDAANIFGNEVATVWINPDLGSTAPSEASAALSDLILLDHALMGLWISGNADTYFDELRFGTTYADVAPIAAGQAGDFDGDLDVDGADFLKWQRELGDGTSLTAWEDDFGAVSAASVVSAVPEPSSLLFACTMTIAAFAVGRRRLPSAK